MELPAVRSEAAGSLRSLAAIDMIPPQLIAKRYAKLRGYEL
jgi:hypothetical protein